MRYKYQVPSDASIDRKEHCWIMLPNGKWKCVLCGGVCQSPPAYPTASDWLPPSFEPLTDKERAMVPRKDPHR